MDKINRPKSGLLKCCGWSKQGHGLQPRVTEYATSHLEGMARREVLAVSADQINTAAKVCVVVKTAFEEPRSAAALREALFARHRDKVESVRDYANALLLLKARLAAEAGEGQTTNSVSALNQRVVEGIRPAPLREKREALLGYPRRFLLPETAQCCHTVGTVGGR